MNYNEEYFENIIANYKTRLNTKADKFISIIEKDLDIIKNIKFGLSTTKDNLVKEHEINIKRIQEQNKDYIANIDCFNNDFIYFFKLINLPEADPNSLCYKQDAVDSYFSIVMTVIINCNIFIQKNFKDDYSRRVKGHTNNNKKRTSGKKSDTIKTITNNFVSLIEYFKLTDNLYLVDILTKEKEYALNLDFSNKNDIFQRCYKCLFEATYELLIANKYSYDVESFLASNRGDKGLDNSICKETKDISLSLITSFFDQPLKKVPTITTFKDTNCLFNYLSKFY